MLLADALDGIIRFAESTPRIRIRNVLRRLSDGQTLEFALTVESVDLDDRRRLSELAATKEFAANPGLFGNIIDAAYRELSRRTDPPQPIWTGPRLDSALRYGRTFVSIRAIVDSATSRIVLAGYRVTTDTMHELGLWSAVSRGVSLTVISNHADFSENELLSMTTKGAKVFLISAADGGKAKFHVKALIADGIRAVVGSANFTHLGINKNIELGVALHGDCVKSFESILFSYLKIASATGWIVK